MYFVFDFCCYRFMLNKRFSKSTFSLKANPPALVLDSAVCVRKKHDVYNQTCGRNYSAVLAQRFPDESSIGFPLKRSLPLLAPAAVGFIIAK